MWELDHKESWAPKNWCFWTVLLEKTFESPLNYKELKPVYPKGNQSWIFFGRTDAEAGTPILWLPDVKKWLIGKEPDQDPVSPTVSLSHQEASKPLILLPQRADRMKTTITENCSNWSHGPQPCLTQWNYEPCRVVPPKMDGSWWRVLTKRGPLEKGMGNHFSVLAFRTAWTVWGNCHILILGQVFLKLESNIKYKT